jgi:CRP-like cAMP-binding protein
MLNVDTIQLSRFIQGIDESLDLPPGFVANFKSIIEENHYVKQQVFKIRKNASPTYFMLIKGCLRQYCILPGPERRELTRFFWFAGNVFSSPPIGIERYAGAGYEVITDAHLISVRVHDFTNLVSKYPQLRFEPRIITSDYSNLVENHIYLLTQMTAEERYNELFNEHPQLFLQAKQKDIAQFLAIKPDTLGRIRKRKR